VLVVQRYIMSYHIDVAGKKSEIVFSDFSPKEENIEKKSLV